MLLDEFVAKTLTAIAEGIDQAQKDLLDMGVEVAAPLLQGVSQYGQDVNPEGIPVYIIKFEVELSDSTLKQGKGKIGVAFATIGAGASKESESTNASTTRIKFEVPMTYPCRNTRGK